MGRKGGSKHLKRMPTPVFWPIHRKEFQWISKPRPGPHPLGECLPLLLVIRDILGLAKTRREVGLILSEGQVRVDGKVRRDERFPLGLMDVVVLTAIDKAYRVVPAPNRGLALHPIEGEERGFKLCRIDGKTSVKGGHLQLNLHDGRNILVEVKDPKNPKEDVYKTFDVLKLSVPKMEILGHIKFGEGVLAVVTGGKNIGRHGKIVRVEKGTASRPTIVTIEDVKGDQFQTTADYVFVIGKGEPWTSLPEV